ncbi:hypothetical protein WS51_28125 [Burkholderia territorii]|uniref:hypothetical protein n=1 Tax=Burkholderia cepacia complex TaxID=87882 RepID=UPI00075CA7D3|nr:MULTISPECIES: hypothetical protein [Burkholderia cepacia complex]AOI67558.1 hypothetical protein WS51_28125 [Burkholderia territorii]KWB12307.1 hypothetical protein WL32_38315 [Burkholderia cepacia]
MKKTFITAVVGLFSLSAHAQFGQLLQSVKDQVSNTAQMQVNQGVRAATDKAVQSAQTQTHKMVDSVRSSSDTTTKPEQDAKSQ